MHRSAAGDRIVGIEFEPTTDLSVDDLVRELAPSGDDDVGLRVDGVWYSPCTPLRRVPLREGSLVEPVPRPARLHRPPPPSARTLTAIGGLRAGERWLLPEGAPLVIGRSTEADLVLSDPTVSRHHALLRSDAIPTIVETGSLNGVRVNGSPVTSPTAVEADDVIGLGATRLVWRVDPNDRSIGAGGATPDARGIESFNRPPRTAPPIEPVDVTLPGVPSDPPAPEPFSWAGVIIPVLAGGVVALVLSPIFAIFAALGPVVTIGTWYERRRRSRRSTRAETRSIEEALARLAVRLPGLRLAERQRLAAMTPDPGEVVRRAIGPSVRCWERRPADPDHLVLGIGSIDARWAPPTPVSGDAAPHPDATALIEALPPLIDAPVRVSLGPGRVIGLVGDRAATRAMAASLVLQAAVHHGPADLVLSVLASQAGPPGERCWGWVRWLPHADDVVTGTRGALVATRPEHVDRLVQSAATDPTPRDRLVVVDGSTDLVGSEAVGRSLLRAERVGAVVLVSAQHQLPAACTTVAVLDDPAGRITVIDPRAGTATAGVLAWGVRRSIAEVAARSLARLSDPELIAPTADLPRAVGLLTLYPSGLDAESVAHQWSTTRGRADLGTPIGMDRRGAVRLDLVNDGPHVLIGGTTGSGKSELLRTLVAGLAVAADPEHVSFVLVDYKGGAAFDRCRDLPHVAGLVTDLDGALAERALRCLEAELRHREARLRDVGAEDLAAFRARTAGTRHDPLPRLVVVVDEFAALAADLPEFLDSLVGIARQGRSLGVHLVLATQRPAGVITDEIRANTGCRIALRVTDRHDSVDVVDSPVAAAIARSRPGQAFARFGPTELIAFQTAMATARSGATGAALRIVDDDQPVERPGSTDDESGPTDLERVVESIRVAHRMVGTRDPRSPWPEPLPVAIVLDDLAATPSGAAWLVDDPSNQSRSTSGWNPSDGHLVALGAPGAGTTSTLAAVVLDLAARYEADRLHVHVIDLDSGRLDELAALPHVGSVVAPVDSDRRVRLMRMLERHVARARGCGSHDTDVVLVVDDLGGLTRAHDPVREPEIAELFERLWADGPGTGVSVVTSIKRATDLAPTMAATAGSVLVHRVADPAESLRFGCRADTSGFPAGRAVRTTDGLEVQVGWCGDDLARPVARLADSHGSVSNQPTRVGSLDESVAWDALPARAQVRRRSIELVFARDDLRLAACGFSLDEGGHALVVGPGRSGRTDLLAILGLALGERAIVVGDDASDLARRSGLGAIAPADFRSELHPADSVVLVDDADRIDDPSGAMLEMINDPQGPRVVAACSADRLRGRFGHWSAELRSCRTGVILQPSPLDGDLLGVVLPPRLDLGRHPGRGVVVEDGRARIVQVARLCD